VLIAPAAVIFFGLIGDAVLVELQGIGLIRIDVVDIAVGAAPVEFEAAQIFKVLCP
jgi:hypothetical protein